jgi:adenine-specific DNA-methyltransferase
MKIPDIKVKIHIKSSNKKMEIKHEWGQYFTTDIGLKEKLFNFILNKPKRILEPCVGRGDLVIYVLERFPKIKFDMYEIDTEIKLLEGIDKNSVRYGDFLEQKIPRFYETIIGNPPYVKTRNGNLYVKFIKKCYGLLSSKGELIFIVPSAFLKLTGTSKLLEEMMSNGNITHIYHPHNEGLFEGASIDVIVFRYAKGVFENPQVLYNDERLYVTNTRGMITFEKEKKEDDFHAFEEYFDIYVGLVCGRENIFRTELGNIDVMKDEGEIYKYIYIKHFPCDDEKINGYLLENKEELLGRKIRKFNDSNWFEWGALRNIKVMEERKGEDCIYVRTITRKTEVSFVGKVGYFGGGLIMLIPTKDVNLHSVVEYLNSEKFKKNFMFAKRFKIGHRQISNSSITI